MRRAGAPRGSPLWKNRPVLALGGAYLVEGRLADAARIAQHRLAAAREVGERGVEGQLLRLLGEIESHPTRLNVDAAEAHYRQALSLAEALGLRPLLAHCHLGLGILSCRAGKHQKARDSLTNAMTMFGEMDMRYWQEQADTAMAELG